MCGHRSCVGAGEWAGLRTEETWWVQALVPFGGAGGLLDQARGWLSRPALSPSLRPPLEPDNEAHMRSSRPCSPVHHHEGHAKLASSPHRASPVRMGPAYVLKKGSEERAGGEGRRAGPPILELGQGAGAGRVAEVAPLVVMFGSRALATRGCARRPSRGVSEPS